MNQTVHKINYHALPESLQSLIDCVGEAAAFCLVEWRGGASICVPKQTSPEHPLLEMMGAKAFSQLVECYAGETVMLPKNDAIMRQLKHARIRQLRYEQRMPIDQIALKTGYTMRRVFQILAEDIRPPDTGDLFEDL